MARQHAVHPCQHGIGAIQHAHIAVRHGTQGLERSRDAGLRVHGAQQP